MTKQEAINRILEGYSFQTLPKEWKEDFDVVKNAVIKQNKNFQLLSDVFRNNKELALLSISNINNSYTSMSENLKNDEDIILKTINYHPDIIKILNEKLINDMSFIQKALNENVHSIGFLKKHPWKKNKKFILDNVDNEKNLDILSYIDKSLFEDKYFLSELIKKNFNSIKYIPEPILNENDEIVKEAIKLGYYKIYMFKNSFLVDEDVMAELVEKNPKIYEFIRDTKKSNKKVLNSLFRNSIEDLRLLNDKVFIELLIFNDSKEFWENKDFLLKIVEIGVLNISVIKEIIPDFIATEDFYKKYSKNNEIKKVICEKINKLLENNFCYEKNFIIDIIENTIFNEIDFNNIPLLKKIYNQYKREVYLNEVIDKKDNIIKNSIIKKKL